MRTSSSILVSLALLVAFVEAPFLHTHQHESTQRHAGAFLHFHLKSVHPIGTSPEFRDLDPNEDAQFQSWFSATATDSGSITPVIHAEPFTLPAPELSGWSTETPLRTGHDPPLLSPRSPRAPPA